MGSFTRDMEPKLSYFTLDELINKEWRTNCELKADNSGKVAFRGFRGNYKFSWISENGQEESMTAYLK